MSTGPTNSSEYFWGALNNVYNTVSEKVSDAKTTAQLYLENAQIYGEAAVEIAKVCADPIVQAAKPYVKPIGVAAQPYLENVQIYGEVAVEIAKVCTNPIMQAARSYTDTTVDVTKEYAKVVVEDVIDMADGVGSVVVPAATKVIDAVDRLKKPVVDAMADVDILDDADNDIFPLGAKAINAAKQVFEKGLFSSSPKLKEQVVNTEKVVEDLKEKAEDIKRRLKAAPATPEQVKAQVTKFGANASFLLTMKTIDYFICGMDENEETYFKIFAGCKTESDFRRAYFAHLNKSGLFFLVRWVAKLAYFFMLPAMKKNLQNGVMSIFGDFDKHIKQKAAKGFDARFNCEIQKNNIEMGKWIEALEKVSKDEGITKRAMHKKLEKELSKPEYHDGKEPTEFYEAMTVKLYNAYFPKLQISKKVFNTFQISGKSTWWKSLLNLLFFPVAGLLYLGFKFPEYTINRMIGYKMKRYLKEEKVLEKLFEKTITATTSASGLSGPLFRSVNRKLEEMLYQLSQGEDIGDKTLKGKLSDESRELLEENVRLSGKARNLFHLNKPFSTKWENWLDGQVQQGVAKGLEDVVVLAVSKLTDQKFVQQTAFEALKSVNEAFVEGTKTEAEKLAQLEKEKKRFRELVQSIVALAIKNEVAKNLPLDLHNYLPEKSIPMISKRILPMVSAKVEQSVDMLIHQAHVRFMVNNVLRDMVGKL